MSLSISEQWQKAQELYLARLKPSTRRAYATGIAQWAAYCRNHGEDVWTAGRALVEAWLVEMRESGLAEATTGTRLAAVSGFYEFCCNDYTSMVDGHEIALGNINPANKHRVKVKKFGKSEYLTAGEVASVLKGIDREAVNGNRDYALLLGYALTGRRNSEWRTLKIEDVIDQGGMWTYRWSNKGHENEVYEMPPVVYEALREHLRCADYVTEYVFQSRQKEQPISMITANNILKRHAKSAGIAKNVYIHMLRHSYAMLARDLGADTLTISENLAHSSTSVTQIYLSHMTICRDTLSPMMAERLGIDKTPYH